MKLLKLLPPLGLILSSNVAFSADFSMPLHACTSYSPRLLPYFDSCADFTVTRGRGCRKTKGICPKCIQYDGDKLEMWLPEYFVEISRHVGRSMFAEPAVGRGLKLHLEAATRWWNKSLPSLPLTANGASTSVALSTVWHARVLPVPYGSLINTYSPLPSSRGVGIPVCYSALSELIPTQWKHGTADFPFAAALSPLVISACFIPAGALATSASQTVLANAPDVTSVVSTVTGIDIDGFPSGCARPILDTEARIKNMSATSDVWNKSKLCIGTLGPLLPRMGEVPTDDPYQSALTVGVKFASVTSDFFGDSQTGGWKLSDKWQLIYPPTPHAQCFRPGQLSQMLQLPFGVYEDGATRLRDNSSIGDGANVKSGSYVFLVWRKRTTCEEPLEPAWSLKHSVHKMKNLGLCKASSAFPQ